MNKLRVLVGCEYSAVVRDAFAALGHDAWSCDIIPSEKSGQHIQSDIVDVLNRNEYWDITILHPPCTKIAVCANSTYGAGKPRHNERIESLQWTANLWRMAISRCRRVALENPRNVLGAAIGKYTQSIQPWQFGHPEQKETWLWLHGLPPLVSTGNVYDEMMRLPRKLRERNHFMGPSPSRGHERSRTYPGIAAAMAAQWSNL